MRLTDEQIAQITEKYGACNHGALQEAARLAEQARTCGTCRFRGEPIPVEDEDGNEKPTGYFLCDRIKHNKSVVRDFSTSAVPPGQAAFVEDGSGYYAALCVESDFGCVLWEKPLT